MKHNIVTKPKKKKPRRPRPTQCSIADDDDDDDDDDDVWLWSAGRVAVMGKTRNAYRSLAENLLRSVQHEDRERVTKLTLEIWVIKMGVRVKFSQDDVHWWVSILALLKGRVFIELYP